MRYLSLQEVISLHSLLIVQSGGSSGLRDRGASDLNTFCRKTLTSIAGFPNALLISSGSHLATFSFNCTKRRKLRVKRSGRFRSEYVLQKNADLYRRLS